MCFGVKRIAFVFLLLLPIKTYVLTIFAENGGHHGVTRSLLSGLKRMGITFEYNVFDKQIDTVIILSGINYLKESIQLKKAGKIKKLVAGPNLVTRANEYGGICAQKEVDLCIVPSEWVKIAYEEEVRALQGRIKTWAAGVDENFWIPSKSRRSKIILYWKTETEGFIGQIERVLQRFHFEVVRVRYDTYSKEQYRNSLKQAALAVFISRSESQGIALMEAWAMNVPTFVWNPEKLIAHGRTYSRVSSAPYLTPLTGCFWKNVDELAGLLNTFVNNSFAFKPREYVLEHFTDTCAAQNMLNIISSIQ